MRVSITLVERTIPGFTYVIDSVQRAFRARITTSIIDFPITRSFRKSREQYEADLLLKELRYSANQADVRLFIFREDLFSGALNFVFGLADGGSCIVSTARLDPRFYGETKDMHAAGELFRERVAKECIHEIGHAIGLSHCDNHECVMVFSDSIEGVDRKDQAFCDKCSDRLSKLLK